MALDETLAAVRARHGMWLPGPLPVARWFLLLELLSNALDEWLAGRAGTIRFELSGDAELEIEDDGGGISEPRLSSALGRVHDRATLDGHRPHVHLGGLRGMGMAPVCALSELMEIDTSDGQTRTRWALSRGEPLGAPDTGPADGRRGTRIRVVADRQLYADDASAGWMLDRLPLREAFAQALADYAPGLVIRSSGRDFVSEGLVERARRFGASAHRPLVTRTFEEGGASYRIVLGWRDDDGPELEELVGNYRRAIQNEPWIGTALKNYARRRGLGPAWKLADHRVALCAIEDAHMAWGTPTGDAIVDPVHRRRVRAALDEALDALCGTAPADVLAFTRVAPR